MSRTASFTVAALFAVALAVLVFAGVATEGRSLAGLPPQPPKTPGAGEVVMAAVPTGADTALKSCVVCHSVSTWDAPRAAPDLAGIVGAEKAASPWYNYSAALQSAGGAWTESDLDKYLTHPPSFLPGTKKTIIGVSDGDERREIIEALKATAGN